MQTLIKIGVNAVALWVAAWAISGITFSGDSTTTNVITILAVAALFGLVNALIKPVLTLLSLPFIAVTLGLFTFIINALMLQITEWISRPLGLSFEIENFWWDAIFGALIISAVSVVLNFILPDLDE